MNAIELKSTRLSLGYKTHRAFAEALGVSKWAVDAWHTGKRPIPAWLPIMLKCLKDNQENKGK